MKIRIRDNSIRLRLMQAEVKQFDEHQQVVAEIQFGPKPSDVLTYRLKKDSSNAQIKASFSNNSIIVSIPEQIGNEWANSNQISLNGEQVIGDNQQLSILIEKDFQCLSDRPGEDESDAFPNPNTEC